MKKTLSILLALAMLLSIIPMTALSTAAADDEIAATAAYGVSDGESLLRMLRSDNSSGEDVVIINVNADISYYVTPQGVSNDKSCLLYACTVGQGKKILNLNGHTLHFYNDYNVIVDHGNDDYDVIRKLYRQCLFAIPLGADLTVNGNSSSGKESLLQYHGKLLNKQNAIDQRDLFRIRGGNLTINSGTYYAGGEVEGHTWTSYTDILPGIYVPGEEKNWMMVSGTPIIAEAGNLTINGGFFEGRGMDGYGYGSRGVNCALYADSDMTSVVINDGHFKGASVADVLHVETLALTGRFVVNAGIFEVDQNDACVGTVYHSYDCSTSSPGQQGLIIHDPNRYAVYYYQEKGGAYTEVAHTDLLSNPYSYFRDTSVNLVYVEPRQGYRVSSELSSTPTAKLEFLINGRQYDPSETVYWSKSDSLKLNVDPYSLYFEDQNAGSYGVEQSLTATADIVEYISESNQPSVQSNVAFTFTKDSKGRYTCDLSALSSTVKAKLVSGHTYCFKFRAKENWKSRRSFTIWHDGSFYVDISTAYPNFGCEITEPQYGKKPSTQATVPTDAYKIDAFVWSEKKAGESSFKEMDANSTFKYDATYRAQFIFSVNEGYTCAADPELYVNGVKATVTYSNSLGLIGYIDYKLPSSQLYSIGLLNVPAPVEGETPIYFCDYPAGYFTVDPLNITWYDADGFSMKKTDTFEGGKRYTVKFRVDAEDGYKFADSVTATVNGYRATITEKWVDFMDESHARVEYTFTCPITVITIDKLYVTVPVPKAGEALPYTASVISGFGYTVEDYNGASWKNGVLWRDAEGSDLPNGTIAEAGKSYTVVVSLVTTDGERYQFADAEETRSFVNNKEGGIIDYSSDNYGVTYTFTVGDGSGGYLIGDADTDEKITILDATAIQRKLASLPVSAFNEAAADADQDTKLTILDATAIQRHLAALATNPNIGTRV